MIIQYNQLVTRLPIARGPERTDILSSLGHARHPSLIKKTVARAMTPDSVSKDELYTTLKGLSTHKPGISALLKFITSGTWMQNPHLSLEKIAPIGKLVLDSLTTIEQHDNAMGFLRVLDTRVSFCCL